LTAWKRRNNGNRRDRKRQPNFTQEQEQDYTVSKRSTSPRVAIRFSFQGQRSRSDTPTFIGRMELSKHTSPYRKTAKSDC